MAAIEDISPGIQAPPLQGRRASLRVIVEDDYEYLYRLSLQQEVGFRWRHRGETPSPEAFVHALWHNVLAQFLITSRADGGPMGHAMAYDANMRNGYAYFAVLLDPDRSGRGWPLEAAALFVNYLFTVWNFRKLYAETLGFNFPQFASQVGRFFQEEGRLKNHSFYDGRYWDMHLLALYREDWDELRPRVLRFALSPPGRRSP